MWENGITAFKVKVSVKVQNVSECLSWWYFQNHRTFCYQIWMSLNIMRKTLLLLLSSGSWWQWELIWSKWDFLLYFLNCWFLATKLGLMIHHQKPECPVKTIGLLHSGSRSQQRVKMLMCVQISSNHQTFCFQTWYCDASLWVGSVMQKGGFAIFRGQGHFRSSYDQITTIFAVSFKLLIILLPNLVW